MSECSCCSPVCSYCSPVCSTSYGQTVHLAVHVCVAVGQWTYSYSCNLAPGGWVYIWWYDKELRTLYAVMVLLCFLAVSNYMYHQQLHWNRKYEVQYTMFVKLAAFPELNMKLYSTWCLIDRTLFNWSLYHSEHIYFMSYYKHFNTGQLLVGW